MRHKKFLASYLLFRAALDKYFSLKKPVYLCKKVGCDGDDGDTENGGENKDVDMTQ